MSEVIISRRFLESIGQSDFNVSLFHYRNHGSDVGRVLVGVQLPSSEEAREGFFTVLDELGYPWVEETQNPVYQQFLVGHD